MADYEEEYYGYKPPVQQPSPVQEEPASSRSKPLTRAEKKAQAKADALEKKREARDRKKNRSASSAQSRSDAQSLRQATPDVQPSDDMFEGGFDGGDRPNSDYLDGLPEDYGVIRDLDYSDARAVDDITSIEEANRAEYDEAGVTDNGKKRKNAPKKKNVNKKSSAAAKKNANRRKKGDKSLPDDAVSAMQGVQLTKKQRRDAKKIDAVQAAKCFRQLALMMQVSRDEIGPIRRIAEQYKGTPIGTVFAKISTDMADNNISFSAAFEKHGKVLPQVVVSLVAVGARAGKESEALIKAAQIIQDNSKTSKQVKSALSEPAFTLVLTVGFLFVVLFGIIPQFKVVFDTLNKPLPLLSQILINVSNVVGWITLVLGILIVGWIIYWVQKGRTNEDLRVWIDTQKLNMKPKIFADLMQVSQMAQVFSNIHTLREINMSERDTLIMTARSTSNWAIRRHLLQHVDLMDRGEARFKELANNQKLFPVDAAYTLIVGEDAGQGTQTIGMMAETYKEEAELSAQQLVVAIGPIANGAVGAVYMLVMLASYLPVFEMYTSIGEA